MAQVHSGPLFAERGGLRVIDCACCGFAHLDPLPDAAALADYYRTDFWTQEKPGALAQIEERLDWWAMLHGDWLELVEQHAPERTLLDVGCGFGHFMYAANTRGWSGVFGIEPSDEASNIAASKNPISTIMVEEWDNDDWPPMLPNQFGAISALWLIEHLPDPLRFLRGFRDRLTDGGVLLAVVPSDFTPLQRHLSASGKVAVPWWWVHYTHLNYFTPITFANLIGRAGFRVVEQLTTYPMENFLSRKDYTDNATLGAELHGRVEAQDLSMTRADRIEFYRLMARRGEGREIVFIGVKDD